MPPKKIKSSTTFIWDGAQGEYIKAQVNAGALKSNPSKMEYKAIYESSPEGILDFQPFYSSWGNVERNLARDATVHNTTGGRARKALANPKAKASDIFASPDKAPTLKKSTGKKTRSSAVKAGAVPGGMLTASPASKLVWETLHSYWVDKDKNSRLHFFVVLPSGCRPKDIVVSGISGGGRTLGMVYTWPSYLFNPERVFEGQTKDYGVNVATAGTSKAAGLDSTTEAMKPTNKSFVTTHLSIHLKEKVEETMVDLTGQPTTKPSFYKIDDTEWSQYPTLLLVVGLMIHRAVDEGFLDQEEEDQDFS
jgi:hypothetical protein